MQPGTSSDIAGAAATRRHLRTRTWAIMTTREAATSSNPRAKGLSFKDDHSIVSRVSESSLAYLSIWLTGQLRWTCFAWLLLESSHLLMEVGLTNGWHLSWRDPSDLWTTTSNIGTLMPERSTSNLKYLLWDRSFSKNSIPQIDASWSLFLMDSECKN